MLGISTRKFTKMFFCRLQVGIMGLFRKFEAAKINQFSVNTNSGLPSFFLWINSLKRMLFVFPAAYISGIFFRRSKSKITNSVVVSNAVNMVNPRVRHLSTYIKPCQPMRWVSSSINHYGNVAMYIFRGHLLLAVVAVRFFEISLKNPSIFIIRDNLFKSFNREGSIFCWLNKRLGMNSQIYRWQHIFAWSKLSVQHVSCFFINFTCFFNRLKRAEINSFPLMGNQSTPIIFVWSNSSRAALRLLRKSHICSILPKLCISQIFNSVVISNAISMIDYSFRPFAVIMNPREPCGVIGFPPDMDSTMAFLSNGSCNGAKSDTGATDLPPKNSNLWLIIKQFSNNFYCKFVHDLIVSKQNSLSTVSYV